MSDMALIAAIRRLGYEQGEMTPHGFRAMARTILDEVLQFRPDFIEHQLSAFGPRPEWTGIQSDGALPSGGR